jgi:hypothetical protein
VEQAFFIRFEKGEFMITDTEKNRFSEICRDVIKRTHERDGIGTYKEKIIHLVLKKYFCDDESCHEVKTGKFVADAATDDTIFEIQTRGLYPLKKKIPSYIEDTDKKLVIVCPIISQKRLVWVDYESGEMTAPRRVSIAKPKNTLLRELMWIGEFIDFSRVELRVVFIDAEEYRLLDGNGTERKIKATKIDKIPKGLVEIVTLDSKDACADFFMPPSLPHEFRAKDFEKATGLRKKGVSAGLRALEQLGVIEREKQGEHKVTYRII